MEALLLRIFVEIDLLIHQGVSELFKLIFRIADVEFIRDSELRQFTNRIYVILGVLILFKIIISAIQYLINPDTLTDKSKGIGGILQRTIISIALLVLVPTIFGFLRYIQPQISSAIPAIILGKEVKLDAEHKEETYKQIEESGTAMSWMLLQPFISEKADKKTIIAQKGYTMKNFDDFYNNVTHGCGAIFADANCYYDYNFIFSIAAGVFAVYVLLGMALDVGIRTIKLGVLQLLAPIPIASYINNQENFKAWYTLALKVYADLFIRFIIIYFIVYFFELIGNGGIDIGGDLGVQICIIIAILMFAKQAPKFICDVLGIKSDGFGDIGEMFKPAWKRAGGPLAAGAGMLTAGVSNAANKLGGWKNMSAGQRLKALASATKSGVAGAASAGLHGGIAAIQGKNGQEVMTAGHKRAVTARQNREMDKINNVTWSDRLRAKKNDFMGLDTKASLAEGHQKAFSTVHQDTGSYKKAVLGRLVKEPNVAIRFSDKADSAMMQLGQLLANSKDAIAASNNQDLMNYFNKFDMQLDEKTGKVTCNGLRKGESIGYHDLAAINADATQAGIGSIAGLTSENGALTLLAQKELFSDAMKNEVYTTSGELHEQINAHAGMKTYTNKVTGEITHADIKTHTDISTAVGQAEQHLTENFVSLSSSLKDKDGKQIIIESPEKLKEMFNNNFAGLDDLVQKASAELSSQMSQDKEAAARASNQRRDSNKNNH